ncbi:MAG: SRPBCC family protein [Planctomycetota bacterium]|nr:SRPBCC family protein [Planctomycetota bacterium]
MAVTIRRQERGYLLECEQRLPAPRDEVFPFFAEAGNLETITPPHLRFRIVTPLPIRMEEGALIDYRLTLRGLPLRWRSEITAWAPPERFTDEQRRGPYRFWIHEHIFEEDGDGTLVKDRVRYDVPGGAMVNRVFVAGDLRRIFRFRARKLETIFPG